ncbi:MAG: hypothetical protein ACOX4M_05670 [Acetivibrionales bacterium]
MERASGEQLKAKNIVVMLVRELRYQG